MAENSKIEWCDHTFNPWEGCTKVSPGCANCYAENRNARWHGGTAPNWGAGKPRRRTSEENWKKPLRWDREAELAERLYEAAKENPAEEEGVTFHYSGRPRVFCASLADWLDDEVPVEWLADLLGVIHRTPNLDWLLLTKRPENWRERMEEVSALLGEQCCHDEEPSDLYQWQGKWADGTPPPNVWIGTSVEDEPRAGRIDKLMEIPAVVRFLSCEPLLGHVNLMLDYPLAPHSPGNPTPHFSRGSERIHWVIAGGESGRGARAMHPAWPESLRRQCAAEGVPFFFKQWGEWCPVEDDPEFTGRAVTLLEAGVVLKPGQEDIEVPGKARMIRRGVKHTGRLLNGVLHDAFPKPRALTL